MNLFIARVELLDVQSADDPYEKLHMAMYRHGGFRRWIELNGRQWGWLPTGTYVAEASRLGGDIRDAFDAAKYAVDSTGHSFHVVVWRTDSFLANVRVLTDVEKAKEAQREATIDAQEGSKT